GLLSLGLLGFLGETTQAVLKGSDLLAALRDAVYSRAGVFLPAIFSLVGIAALAVLIVRKLPRRSVSANSAGWTGFAALLLAILVTQAMPLPSFPGGRPIPRFKSHPDDRVLEFLRNHTGPKDEIFAPFPVDMVGVRRQFLDWRHGIYLAYSREGLARY